MAVPAILMTALLSPLDIVCCCCLCFEQLTVAQDDTFAFGSASADDVLFG